jgi:hypothetical protein
MGELKAPGKTIREQALATKEGVGLRAVDYVTLQENAAQGVPLPGLYTALSKA